MFNLNIVQNGIYIEGVQVLARSNAQPIKGKRIREFCSPALLQALTYFAAML